MNVLSGLVCCFSFGYGMVDNEYNVVLGAGILAYFVVFGSVEYED